MDHSSSSDTNENYSPIKRVSEGLAKLLSPRNRNSEDESSYRPPPPPLRDDRRYSYGSMSGSKSIRDASASTDLGNILENEELDDPLVMPGRGEGRDNNDVDYDSDEDSAVSAHLSNLWSTSSRRSSSSFHLGNSTLMSSRNIMVHERRTSSFFKHGDEYELVNTQLKNNVRLVEDVNLIDDAKGRLYLADYSFFKNSHELKFAMTVPSDIYEKIMAEVSDAFTVPCALYFCCHGGDGAHTGVSHNDYVDIKLAWFFFVVLIGMLMAIEVFVEH